MHNLAPLLCHHIFLGRRDVIDAHASWAFPILDEPETIYHRLLNVWLHGHADQLSGAHRKIVNSEGEPKLKKAQGFLKRKLRGGPTQ